MFAFQTGINWFQNNSLKCNTIVTISNSKIMSLQNHISKIKLNNYEKINKNNNKTVL